MESGAAPMVSGTTRPVSRFAQPTGRSSRWSLWSRGSLLSIASEDSVLSIGSVGSVLSIGSVGSAASLFSVGSAASAGSWLSAASAGSLLSFRSSRGVLASGRHHPAEPWAHALAVASAVVAVGALARRHR